jgi:hypothetical protein
MIELSPCLAAVASRDGSPCFRPWRRPRIRLIEGRRVLAVGKPEHLHDRRVAVADPDLVEIGAIAARQALARREHVAEACRILDRRGRRPNGAEIGELLDRIGERAVALEHGSAGLVEPRLGTMQRGVGIGRH